MHADGELATIVRELREHAEYVSMLIRPPYTAETGEPTSDRWRLRGDATNEQLADGAGSLAGAAEELQRWFDEHGPDDLKDPDRGDRWHGYGGGQPSSPRQSSS